MQLDDLQLDQVTYMTTKEDQLTKQVQVEMEDQENCQEVPIKQQ